MNFNRSHLAIIWNQPHGRGPPKTALSRATSAILEPLRLKKARRYFAYSQMTLLRSLSACCRGTASHGREPKNSRSSRHMEVVDVRTSPPGPGDALQESSDSG